MLTTEMWPIERLSHLYATESSQLSDDDLHPSSDERRPFRAATCSRPGFNKDLDSYWRGGDDDDYRRGGGDNDYRRGDDDDDYRRGDDDDDYRRSCSMPSHERSNPDVDPSRYDDRYYDVSMKHLHPRSNRLDEYGLAGRPFDASNRNVGNDVEGSKPVDGSRGSRPYQNKSMSKTDDSYSGEKRGEDAYRRRNELSQPGDFQGQSSDRVHHLHHQKGHLRDFSESRAISPDLSFGYKVKNVTKPRCPSPHAERSHTRYEGHKMDPRANPRRFASGMDDNPIMVHQYKKSQTCTQSRNDDPNDDRFPTPTNSDQFVVIDDDDDDGGGGDDYDYGGGDDDETKKYHNLRPYRSNKKEIDVEHQQSSDTWARFISQRRSSNETNKEASSMLPPHLNDSTSEEVGGGGTSAHPTNESSTDNKTSRSSQKVALARSHVPKKHSSKDVCVICGDKASGYHYNTLSCEGCKGFFRRTITRGLHYQCKYGGDCVMDTWMRRKCPACRLKRCKQVGMREECLLTEHQCVIRNSRRRMKIKMKKEEESDNLPSKEAAIGGGDMSADDTQAILASLNSDHRDLIERLVNLQDKYEIPSPDDLKLLKEDKMYNASSQDDLSDAIFVHMVEMTILVTRLIVEFAKHLPGFRNLLKEDQIVLLKSSSSEVMMLRTARRYNADSNTIVFGNGVPFSPSSMAFGGLQESVESLFTFSKSMSCLYVDNAEYALLTAMCIFSIRSGLTNPSVVDKLQEVYMEVLLAYISKRRTKCQNYLAKLLMKFVNLRTLGHEHSQTLYNLTLKKGSLPPLLTEYFDISE